MPSVRFRELAVVSLAFLALTVLMTWPVWEHPTRALPSDLYDTLLNTWILGWDSARMSQGFAGVWDPPYFFPYRNTLAFSENLFGLAVFVAPVYWATSNAILTYNVALTFAFVLCGVGMYLLVERLTTSRPAAAIAAVFFAFCPFRFAHLTHLQMIATGWIPVGLYAMHRYFEQRALRWLALCGTAFVLQATTNSYAAYFMAVPLAIVVIDALATESTHRGQDVRRLLITGALTGLALAPIVYRYYRVRADYQQIRLTADIEKYSADLRSYLVGRDTIGIWRHLPTASEGPSEHQLFLGVVPLVLAIAGIVAMAVRRRERARWTRLYLAIAVSGVALSLGPVVHVWGAVVTAHGPYEWLLRTIPGWGGMRVPARFAIIAAVGVAVLAAMGARAVLSPMRPNLRWAATVIVCALLLAEGWTAPLRMYAYTMRGRPADRGVANWLRARAPGAVLHFPLLTDDLEEMNYQYSTLLHGHPIVNGYSGYQTALQQFWRESGGPLMDYEHYDAVVAMIRSLGIRYVIVNTADYSPARRARREPQRVLDGLRASKQMVREEALLDAYAFELQPWDRVLTLPAGAVQMKPSEFRVSVAQTEDRLVSLTDGDRDTRWFGDQDGGTWIAATFSQSTDVAGIALQMAERSLLDFPRALRIESTDQSGVTRVLYDATPYPEFMAGFVRSASYPIITIPLPANATRELRIRETGTIPRWWSVHELMIWRR